MHGNIPIMIGTIPLNNMVPMQQQSTTIDMNTGPTQPVIGWVPAGVGDTGNMYNLRKLYRKSNNVTPYKFLIKYSTTNIRRKPIRNKEYFRQ